MLCFWILAVCLLNFMVNPEITVRGEQRVTLKFLCRSGASPIECWCKLQEVWGDRTMSKTQFRVWHKRFKDGNDGVSDRPRSGRLRSARTEDNVDMIRGMIEDDGALSITKISSRTGISHPIVHRILRQDLKMTRRCAKFIPRELTEPQKWTCKMICDDNIQFLCSRPDPEDFIQRIITGDETWVSTFEPEGKLATTVWTAKRGPRPKKPRTIQSQTKCMMTLFFDCRGVILCEFLGEERESLWSGML